MNKKFNKIVSMAVLSVFSVSCSTNQVTNNPVQQAQISNSKTSAISFKLIKPKDIPAEIIKTTYDVAKEMSDKESKRRGIDIFNLPKNPIGLEIASGTNKLGYILNYIGTSQNTEDVNVEVRAFHSEKSNSYSLNYSGPLTNTQRFAVSKSQKPLINKSSKEEGLSFELIMGLPPEHIINTFEEYTNSLNENLKRFYQPQKINISFEDVFIYAIHNNGEVIGFFFESHGNKVILGERKYADMQIGLMVASDNTIKGNYSLVEFNPKTKINQEPVYKYLSQGDVNLIQLGEL